MLQDFPVFHLISTPASSDAMTEQPIPSKIVHIFHALYTCILYVAKTQNSHSSQIRC